MRITRRKVLAGAAALARYAGMGTVGQHRLVVPFPPGRLNRRAGQAAAGTIADPAEPRRDRGEQVRRRRIARAAEVAKSARGRLLAARDFDSHAVIPSILDKPPLDVERDLVPVLLVGTAPYVIAANADLPYKSFADVLAAAKAKPAR